MKKIILILVTFGLFACNQQTDKTQILQNRLDSLERKLADTYKPGILLTNTCNSCHRATEFEFNVVKIPDTPPFSNQDFKISK